MEKKRKLLEQIGEDQSIALIFSVSIFFLTRFSLFNMGLGHASDWIRHATCELLFVVSILAFFRNVLVRLVIFFAVHCTLLAAFLYQQYFDTSFSFINLTSASVSESKVALDSAIVFLQSPVSLIFGISIISFCLIAWIGRNGSKIPRKTGCIAFALYVSLVCAEVLTKPDLINSLINKDSRYLHSRIGILPVLLAQSLIQPKVMTAVPPSTVPLPFMRSKLPIRDKIIIVQVESLDHKVIDFEYNGQLVTPFLSSLKKKSVYFPMIPHHVSGSSDADFIMLTGLKPVTSVSPYKISDQDYRNTLPKLAGSRGYSFSVYHGNKGNFFSRKKAFAKMGFTKIFHLEDFPQDLLHGESWGIPDKNVFSFIGETFANKGSKTVDFVITLDSHHPFKHKSFYTAHFSKNIYPDRYFNSIRYVDEHLKKLIESSTEPMTVIIYGDHSSCMAYGNQRGCMTWSEWRKTKKVEFVPAMIIDTHTDLSGLQSSYPVVTMYDLAKFTHSIFSEMNPALKSH